MILPPTALIVSPFLSCFRCLPDCGWLENRKQVLTGDYPSTTQQYPSLVTTMTVHNYTEEESRYKTNRRAEQAYNGEQKPSIIASIVRKGGSLGRSTHMDQPQNLDALFQYPTFQEGPCIVPATCELDRYGELLSGGITQTTVGGMDQF